MPINVNFLEQTAETQISWQKSPINRLSTLINFPAKNRRKNQYAVFHQIISNQTLLETSSKCRLNQTLNKKLPIINKPSDKICQYINMLCFTKKNISNPLILNYLDNNRPSLTPLKTKVKNTTSYHFISGLGGGGHGPN